MQRSTPASDTQTCRHLTDLLYTQYTLRLQLCNYKTAAAAAVHTPLIARNYAMQCVSMPSDQTIHVTAEHISYISPHPVKFSSS